MVSKRAHRHDNSEVERDSATHSVSQEKTTWRDARDERPTLIAISDTRRTRMNTSPADSQQASHQTGDATQAANVGATGRCSSGVIMQPERTRNAIATLGGGETVRREGAGGKEGTYRRSDAACTPCTECLQITKQGNRTERQ